MLLVQYCKKVLYPYERTSLSEDPPNRDGMSLYFCIFTVRLAEKKFIIHIFLALKLEYINLVSFRVV